MKTLFDDRNHKPVKRVMVLGRAGIGKSTFCQKIAYDWALGTLFKEKFDVVFHLKLRDLNAWVQQTQNRLTDITRSRYMAQPCDCPTLLPRSLPGKNLGRDEVKKT